LGGLTRNKFLTKICFDSFWRWKHLYLFHKKNLSSWWSFELGNTRTRHMGVRRGGKRALPLGNWDWQAKISWKREIRSLVPVCWVKPCNDSVFAGETLTLHKSQVYCSCSGVIYSDELAVHSQLLNVDILASNAAKQRLLILVSHGGLYHQRSQTLIAPRVKRKVTRGQHIRRWRKSGCTWTSLKAFKPVKVIVRYRQVISSHLNVRLNVKGNLFTRWPSTSKHWRIN